MRLVNAWVVTLAAVSGSAVNGFQLSSMPRMTSSMQVSATMDPVTETSAPNGSMSYAEVNKLAYRGLQKQCKSLELEAVGTTAALRGRLLDHFGLNREKKVEVEVPMATAEEIEELCATEGITFCDESDPDFDFKTVLSDVMQKSSMGHWKTATRKLKTLHKKHSTADRPVPREAYLAVLEACAANRLNGARASEPARKILEDMSTFGYEIPAELANVAVVSSIGEGDGGTHDGFGGIDTALAIVAAVESSPGGSTLLTDATYEKLVHALALDGAVEEAVLILRSMVVDKYFTPMLSTFGDVAKAAAKSHDHNEDVVQVLTFAKAAGYELDNIAAVDAGRDLLASGVIAAEKMDNLALGLRLLTAAAKAEGCAPDSGDDLVAASSSAAQRACTLIHKRAIGKACEDSNWKLAVKLLELMPKRSLTPATSVWRNVVSCCCKNEKSRKATAILLDWITLSKEGKAEKPPVSVFNTVVNTCEVCGEEELTVKVLDVMRDTLETEGNIITFNIALKRLAKAGNVLGCEGILIGMLKEGLEPNVVSYTTTIGACAKAEMKNPAAANMWLERMRSRGILPNFHTYNTALAACVDGKLESTFIASKIATDMLEEAEREVACGLTGAADFKSTLPDSYSKVLGRKLMKQLRDNWRSGDIDMALAKATVRVPLLKLVDFEKKLDEAQMKDIVCVLEDDEKDDASEQNYEFTLLKEMHDDDHRTAMV
jgi:pentatricopeptide repeat protein